MQAQSREEILADKVIAFAFRENRIKNRDLWDIAWLIRSGIVLPLKLIPRKIEDHKRTPEEFINLVESRLGSLRTDPKMRDEFVKEMQRFLPAGTIAETVAKPDYWDYLVSVLTDQGKQILKSLG